MDETHFQLAQVIALMAGRLTPEQCREIAMDIREMPDEMAGAYRRNLERMAQLFEELADESAASGNRD